MNAFNFNSGIHTKQSLFVRNGIDKLLRKFPCLNGQRKSMNAGTFPLVYYVEKHLNKKYSQRLQVTVLFQKKELNLVFRLITATNRIYFQKNARHRLSVQRKAYIECVGISISGSHFFFLQKNELRISEFGKYGQQFQFSVSKSI